MPLTDDDRRELRLQFSNFNADGSGTSPVYARIATIIGRHNEILDLFEQTPPERRRPVSLFAAVHYLILSGEQHPLADIYEAPEARGALDRAAPEFVDFCEEFSEEIVKIMRDRTVQTNEVNRCVGLLPALMIAHRSAHRPLGLVELGASAGLNMLFDRYRYDYSGGPVIGPPGATVRLSTQVRNRMPKLDAAAPPVDYRVGVDLEPVEVADEDQERWLRACIWVGEVAREQRFEAAWNLAQREWPDVVEGDAVDKLEDLVDAVPDHLELCVTHSWMMGWMGREQREKLAERIAHIGRGRPVWWVSFESPNRVPGLDAPDNVPADASVLGLTHIDGDKIDRRVLAKVQHHGAWLDWLDGDSTAW
jgi:hypothetical protein